MANQIRFSRIVSLVVILLALCALGPARMDTYAMQDERDLSNPGGISVPFDNSSLFHFPALSQPAAVVACTSTGCPASADAALDLCVERTDFCVYYTTDSISETEAEWAADVVQDYWDRFVSLSFLEPKHSDQLEVYLSDIPGDCNGGSSWDSNAISTYAGCFDVTLLAQKVLGHELTHRLQYAYDTGAGAPIQTKFLKKVRRVPPKITGFQQSIIGLLHSRTLPSIRKQTTTCWRPDLTSPVTTCAISPVCGGNTPWSNMASRLPNRSAALISCARYT